MKTIQLNTTILISILSLLVIAGCGNINNKLAKSKVTAEDMRQQAINRLDEKELRLFAVPYALNDTLKKIAWELKDPDFGPMNQARLIANYLLKNGHDGLGIEYTRNQNFSAIEVFKYRQANCISYTNLFIGLAREIGLDANYIEVTEVDTFSKVNGTVVYNSHICAAVFTGPTPYIIDFSLREHPQYHSWRTISDLEAAASMYNNMGSYHYLSGIGTDARKVAKQYFNIARKLYPEYAPVYNNIGVLELREDDIESAKRNFEKSLELKPDYFAAYQNLATIYISLGDTDSAIDIMKKSIEAEPRNQYAYVNLAKLQMQIEDYKNAEQSLRDAISIKESLAEARHMLSKLMIMDGRHGEAKAQLMLALKYDSEDQVAKNKMELIEELAASGMKAKFK